jgi:TetR/AcrR family transcriptional regulator, fatty acid metabolism regulator protein
MAYIGRRNARGGMLSMKGELRKNQIITCATKLFAKNGYYNTHVETILKEAKIGKGTFYLYFKNKEELFISILVNFLDEWEQAAQVPLSELAQKNLLGYYKALVARSLKFFKEHEDLCNLYLKIGPSVNELHVSFVDIFEHKMVQYVTDDLRKGVDAGFVRKDLDTELIANMIIGSLLRVVYYYFVLNHKRKVLPDIEHIADQFFNLIFKGMHV